MEVPGRELEPVPSPGCWSVFGRHQHSLVPSDSVAFSVLVVTDQAFPFELKAPNAQSIKAMAEAQDIIASRQARFESADALINDLEKNSSK